MYFIARNEWIKSRVYHFIAHEDIIINKSAAFKDFHLPVIPVIRFRVLI